MNINDTIIKFFDKGVVQAVFCPAGDKGIMLQCIQLLATGPEQGGSNMKHECFRASPQECLDAMRPIIEHCAQLKPIIIPLKRN
jgi:hypothetical protein